MRRLTSLIALVVLAGLLPPGLAGAQKQEAQSPHLASAKTVYFRNLTGSDAVGKSAVAQLKKWGKYQITTDPRDADLIFILSADVYKGGNIDLASGQTGTVGDNGQIAEDPVPTYNKESPTRYAYLTVIDRRTGETLWDDKHVWGGLLTGFNSAGVRLIKELENQTKKTARKYERSRQTAPSGNHFLAISAFSAERNPPGLSVPVALKTMWPVRSIM